jgi:tetratricopeptide (TPR) repeat protein/S1-C subfamily serine protease
VNIATHLISSLLLTHIVISPLVVAAPIAPTTAVTQANGTEDTLPAPAVVKQTAQAITVRISTSNNGGSGVIIGRKGNNYLVLTNAHVVRRATKFDLQAPDGKSYSAQLVNGSFDAKSDLALLQFTSSATYQLANLSAISSSPIDPGRIIYSAGYPFDAKNIRITKGTVSQTTDIPFDDGTQVGYVTDKGEKGIRQGMSGGAIVDSQGLFIGINTIGIAPILPDYTYSDGSKPIAKLKAEYTRANWGIPVYNFLVRVKPDLLYEYNLPIVEHQVTPTGYIAQRSQEARKLTVRIENNETGSGAIVAKSGNARDGFTYYVLTAKHVVDGMGKSQIVTYDQDRHQVSITAIAKGVDLAVVKFSSKNDYPVGKLNEYSPTNNDLVFVGGFPERSSINSPLWQWQFNPGFIYSREQGKLETQNKLTFADRYDLLYSSMSYGGMSGGPVFDRVGNIIGIHGKAESENLNSAGISIQTFTGLLQQLQVDPKLLNVTDTPPRELLAQEDKNVKAAMESIPKPEGIDPDGKRSLAYGTQLYRVRKYAESVAALKTAVARGQVLSGNYRLASALLSVGDNRGAANAIAKAISLVVNSKRDNGAGYYFWKIQSNIMQSSGNYSRAIAAINKAIYEEDKDPKYRVRKDLTLRNQKAFLLYNSGSKQAAIDEYTLIIEQQPEAYAYNNRGNVRFDLGQKEAAIADYDRAIAIDYKYAVAYYNRGNVKSDLGQKAAAIADFDRAIAIAPKSADAYINRGSARFALGQKATAVADFDRAIAIAPKYAKAYNNRGNVKSNLGQTAVAIADFDLAIAIDPQFAQAYYNRGIARFALGQKATAIIDFDRAIVIAPKYANAYINRGIARFALGQKVGAIADFDRAIAIDPQLANAYNNRGNVKSNLGQKEVAIADFDRAIALDPQLANAYYNRGIAKSDLGQKAAAIADFNRAITIDSKYANAYINRGIARFSLGQKEVAIADFDRAIAIDPQFTQAYYNRGIARFALGQKVAAITDFDRVIAIDPKDANAYNNRGMARFALGQKAAAITDFDRAIAIDPKDARAYNNRGMARFALGQKAAAIADFDRAIAIDPKYAKAYANRGDTRSNLGQKVEAIRDMRAAAELFRQQGRIDDYQRAMDLIKQLQR